MKRPSIKIGAATAVALFSFLAAGPGNGQEAGGAKNKAAETTSKKGSASKSNKSLSERLVGYWSPDPKAMLELALAQMPEAAKADPATMTMVKEQVTTMAGKMVIHFDGKKSFMYGSGSPEEASYKIVATDEKTNTLTAEITDADGKTETGNASIDGDKLTLQKGDEEMKLQLLRITEAEFKKRTAPADAKGAPADAKTAPAAPKE